MRDKDWHVRWNAAIALGNLKDPRGLQPLIETLGDRDYRPRWMAAEAFGKIGDPRAVNALENALQD